MAQKEQLVKMVKPKVLTEVLSQANTGGILAALLVNPEGSLLAFSGYDEDNQCRITAAIATNTWHAYAKSGLAAFNDSKLHCLLFESENGRVCVCQVSSLLLCLYGKPFVPFGILKAKTEALVRYLEEPISEVAAS